MAGDRRRTLRPPREDGKFEQPLYVTAPPGDADRIFVVERGGTIRIVDKGATRSRPFLRQAGVSTYGAEQGMLSMVFSPDYSTSGRFYVVFTAADKDLELVEYRRSATDGDLADPSTKRMVMVVSKSESTHNAGQLQFGPDGLLYLSVGDGGCCGDAENDAQRLDSLLGKILRIDPTASGPKPYAIPPSNPFVGRRGARGEVYAYGLRNPYRFSFDRDNGAIAVADVGDVAPKGDEEVDFLTRGTARGANFGWNVFEGRRRFRKGSAPDLVRPAFTYSRAGLACAIIGGYVVRDPGNAALKGRYVYGDSCTGRLSRSSSPPAPAQATGPSGGSSRRPPSARTRWAGSTWPRLPATSTGSRRAE